MGAVTKEAPNRFRIRFQDLGSTWKRLLTSARGGFFQVDPFLIARAIVQVMKSGSMRSAAGRPLVWNEYRVILAREDFEPLRPLHARVQEEIGKVVAEQARRAGAEVVGDLCVRLIADEGNELAPGEGVVRVEFSRSDALAPPGAGELTVRIGLASIVTGELRAAPAAAPEPSGSGNETVIVRDPGPAAAYGLRWSGGSADLPRFMRVVLGREHPGAPENFIALRGASERINKKQLWLLASDAGLTVGRLQAANPVSVDGKLIRAGEQIEVARPELRIDLSGGALILTVTRAPG